MRASAPDCGHHCRTVLYCRTVLSDALSVNMHSRFASTKNPKKADIEVTTPAAFPDAQRIEEIQLHTMAKDDQDQRSSSESASRKEEEDDSSDDSDFDGEGSAKSESPLGLSAGPDVFVGNDTKKWRFRSYLTSLLYHSSSSTFA